MRAAIVLPLAMTTALLLSASSLLAQGVADQPAPVPGPPDQSQAQQVQPALSKPTLPRGRITGTVYCGDTRQPARGATVMAMRIPTKGDTRPGGPQFMAHVGTSGSYVLDHVSPGEYAVVAMLPGYLSALDDIPSVPAVAGQDPQATMLNVLAQHGTVNVPPETAVTRDLVLERGAAISGRVLYSDGSPATQVTISVEDTEAPPKPPTNEAAFDMGAMLRTLITHQSPGTDDLGHFRIAGIKPGKYRIAIVEPPSTDTGTAGDQLGMVFAGIANPKALRFYAGGTVHKKEAKTYELRTGDELNGLDIQLPIDGLHFVRGAVSAVDGRSLNMGSLTLTDTSDDALVFYAALGFDGAFQFGSIPPGTYTLAVKDARIGAAPGNVDPDYLSQMALAATNAFADDSISVIVKDTDLTGVSLTLTEVPVPKNATTPDTNPGDPVPPAVEQ